MKIIYFHRHINKGYSIQRVFSTIIDEIKHKQTVEEFFMPYYKADPMSIIKNLVYVLKNKNKKGISHITGDVHYIAMCLGRKTVLTIHDVGSILKGNVFRKILISLLWLWLPALCVKKITVISEFTRKELASIIPFAKHKIQVVHNAFIPNITHLKKRFNIDCPIVLHIGTKPNKNLERTIIALKDIPCKLVVIGKLNAIQSDLLQNSQLNYENYFDLDYSEIIKWYQTCDIVSFPSTYEGFGVPVLEANAAGRPIIAGNVTAIPEVANDAACLVDSFSIDAIREGFCKVINNSDYRNTLIEKGFENIKRFSPEKIAAQYNTIYNEIIKS